MYPSRVLRPNVLHRPARMRNKKGLHQDIASPEDLWRVFVAQLERRRSLEHRSMESVCVQGPTVISSRREQKSFIRLVNEPGPPP